MRQATTLPVWSRWDAAASWAEAMVLACERYLECVAAGRQYAAKQYVWRSYVHEQYGHGQFWIISGMPRSVGGARAR
jgi:hypothetical protein